MGEDEELRRQHEIFIDESMAGFLWQCTCGASNSDELPRRSDATRDADRHIADAVGVTGGTSDSDREFELMVRLRELGRTVEPEDLRSPQTSYAELLDVLATLHSRRYISIEKPMYGDNRLMGAHGIALSFEGQEAVRHQLNSASDILGAAEADVAHHATRVSSFTDLEATRSGRAAFMSVLYQRTGGSTSQPVDAASLASELGWDLRLTASVVQYLVAEGLVTRPSLGAVSIAHAGVKEVEELQASPDQPTQHFGPITNNNYVTILGNNSGMVQAGTTSSTQSQANEAANVANFLSALASALDQSRQDPVANAMGATVDVVRQSLNADGVDSPTVRRLLPVLRDFAVNLAASGAFLGLTQAVAQLPPLR